MTVQPKYHWQFEEGQGATATDTVSGVKAKLSNATWDGHGRIGQAIKIDGRIDNSRIVFGDEVGRFGTSDFTVTFGMKVQGTYGQNDLHIIGNRSTQGHGNFFSIRMKNQGQLTVEVDENTNGKNYAFLDSKRPLKDGKWHHIAAVREGRTLKLYIDGELADEGKSKTGIANITTSAALLLGDRGRKTAIAEYEDIRIYDTALNAAEIRALIPPENRPLRAGEIELVATDNAAVILTHDVENLSRFSSQFQKLRVGQNTGVTLFQQNGFEGVSQKLYADLPDIRRSRLGDFPSSIRIGSAVGEPFIGKWMIKAPNGQFLSLGKSSLTTAAQRTFDELFSFHYKPQHARLQLIPGSHQESALVKVSPGAAPADLFVDEADSHKDQFSLTNTANNQWLKLNNDNTFSWTQQKEGRAVFVRVVKMADNEGQVGELSPGEVALYEHVAYWGKTWILSDSDNDVSGNYTNFKEFQDLNDRTSSIRLGPDTGVTLFKHINYHVAEGHRETEIEDIVANVPDLKATQVGDEAISSIRVWKTVEPERIFDAYTSKLSQDYRMVGDALEEFSAYRTILRFSPGAGEVEVSATDLTQIEVEGTVYEIDEERSVTLSPNAINRLMITSEADGINTPGLKIRTSAMAASERVVIFPNQDVHQQIAALEGDALWNGTDAKGNFIVDHQAHSQADVGKVQSTIKKMAATVAYTTDAPVKNRNARVATENGRRPVQSANRAISSATIDQPWALHFEPVIDSKDRRRPGQKPSMLETMGLLKGSVSGKSVSTDRIQEVALSQDDLTQIVGLASRSEGAGRGLFGNLFKKIKEAVKKAVSIVVGAIKKVVHVIVETAEEIIDFVVDTAEKVVAFVEGVVEKVVDAIKKFVEFLQFLFDWDDILATQRYLVRVINSGFDFATQAAAAAKPRVSAFVDDLQDSVEDGMNSLVTALGGKPSAVKEGGVELPEAFEWLLSKLLGGSKPEDDNISPNSGTNASGDSALGNFLTHFFEAFEDAIGAGLRVSEGLIESIKALLANPRQPELALIALIEAFRDAIIQSLEAVENVALGLLDVIEEGVKLLKNLLNAEIEIPFISNLFERIGAGKLTILNLSSLLLAIPVTVMSKLATGTNLFANLALPFDRSTRAQARLAAAPLTGDEAPAPSKTELRLDLAWTIIGTCADGVGHLVNSLLDVRNKPKPGAKLSFSFPKMEKSWTSGRLEFVSWLCSFVSWSVSYPAQFEPANKEERRELILWSVRGGALAVDGLTLVGSSKRMRRSNGTTVVLWFLYSLVDMVLFSLYLAAVEEDNDRIRRSDISSEVFSWLPSFTCIYRAITLPEPAASIAHFGHSLGVNLLAFGVSVSTGGLVIDELVKALRKAREDAHVVAALAAG